ncbi:MAG TPA: hypothetical protein VEA60_14325 [Allosphingosinicella sp.]|nr:hypothetical protein [Allosphingosinicella sp.]
MSRAVARRAAFLALFAALALPAPTALPAAEVLKIAPASLDSRRAYLLVRLGKRDEKVWNLVSFYRYDPTAEDLRGKGRAKANPVPRGEDKAAVVDAKPFLAEEGNIRTYLVAVTPGRWVIASSPTTSYSLGSYQFDARAGEITDLGTLYMGAENGSSIWPRLAGIHSAPDIEKRGYTVADALLVERAATSTPVPAAVAALPRRPADYLPAPRFGNHSGQMINAVLPLEGTPDP